MTHHLTDHELEAREEEYHDLLYQQARYLEFCACGNTRGVHFDGDGPCEFCDCSAFVCCSPLDNSQEAAVK